MSILKGLALWWPRIHLPEQRRHNRGNGSSCDLAPWPVDAMRVAVHRLRVSHLSMSWTLQDVLAATAGVTDARVSDARVTDARGADASCVPASTFMSITTDSR